ncbi:MAG: Na+/H+ antiporter NhaC family protein [Ruminococcaceae bacterium]|nr:Na+/H+ antiporter NhaC family protein [Oscillospiraceae bacterium]
MSKTKKIILAAAILVIVILLVIAAATGGANKTVKCRDCEEGLVACGSCGGTAVLEDGTACEDCDAGFVTCESCEGEVNLRGSWWALLPPVIAIGLALITKEVFSSLFIGIVSGALLYSDFSLAKAIDAITSDGLISAVSGSAGIFIFLVELGIIVALINKAGGSAAFGNWAKRNIKSRVGAQIATFVLGILIFVDDYFNCLTVGSVMRPVTDSKRISRAKLAYLIDATAAPICMIAPISSWAAAVSTYVPDGEGISLFVRAIPFNFYSLLTLVFIVTIVLMKFDYGPMKLHEKNAIENGDLFTTGKREDTTDNLSVGKGGIADLIVPIVALIVSCVGALIYVGFQEPSSKNLIDAFANTDATVGLPWGGMIALILIVAYLMARRIINFKASMDCVPQGFIAMVPAILILTFATALKNMTALLGAQNYVGDLMSGSAGALGSLLPAIIFLVACGLSFATGTSWGTFGILIPIVLSIFPIGSGMLSIIGISACLAGSVCGDHCSPISDTTIMSSAGAQSDHLNHVSTQMPYALTVAGISFVMFILAGFIKNAWICLPIGIVLTVGTLFGIKFITERKKA